MMVLPPGKVTHTRICLQPDTGYIQRLWIGKGAL